MVIIAITGTPGTGKSTLSKKLVGHLNILDSLNQGVEKHLQSGIITNNQKPISWINYDVTSLIKENKLYSELDVDGTLIVDVSKLKNFLIKKIHNDLEKNIIIDSFFSHELPSSLVDICIVCTCDISQLNQRLFKRNYSSKKIRENLDVEILDQCGQEAKENNHHVIYYDSSKDNFSDFLSHLITILRD